MMQCHQIPYKFFIDFKKIISKSEPDDSVEMNTLYQVASDAVSSVHSCVLKNTDSWFQNYFNISYSSLLPFL